MELIKKWVLNFILGKWIKPILKTLDGRKTLIGLIQLVIGLGLWVVPAAYPEFSAYIGMLKTLGEYLESNGIQMGDVLYSGAGFTLVGLIHKIKKIFSDFEPKDET